jgi:site-specific DNA recombinase
VHISRVIGYIRCSTQEQGESGLSLDAQRSRIRAWCAATGADLVEVLEDRGVSGTRRLVDRSGGARLADLLDQRRSAVDAVVVVRLDRLGRDAAETLQLLKRFASGPVGLVSITERLDLTTPQGRAMAGVAAVFAELERSLIGERTSEALRALKGQGRVYGPIPFGFDRRGAQLVPNGQEQKALAYIRDRRDCLFSFASIASMLNDRGIKSKRGGQWHAMSVRSVLLTSAKLPSGHQPVPSFSAQVLQPS